MFKYIYGPVSSWRLGISLGIDLLSMEEKICSFDCIYCQVGKTGIFSCERKIFVPTEDVINELEQAPDVRIDYYTFSGRGEPTLARNLKEVAEWIRKEKKGRCALLTNSSTITDTSIQQDIMIMDLISFKLDAATQKTFEKINRPCCGIKIEKIIEALSEFRKIYKGIFTIQSMFVEENLKEAKDIAEICMKLQPDIVYLNTPLRDSAVLPLSEESFSSVEKAFVDIPHLSVFHVQKKKIKPISLSDTVRRRGKKL
ncbi:MAG: radical SAM protein [Candidatus Omnitrophica bacterium]|nr:radical SAM protein [Candidatus Omnitrophota bacterium]